MKFSLHSLAIILSTTLCDLRAETITDAAHGFSFDLPAGFTPFPEGKDNASTLHSFARKNAATGYPDMILTVHTLGHELSPDVRLDSESVSKGAGMPMTVSSREWKGVQINCVHGSATLDTRPVSIEAVQLPIKPQAVFFRAQGVGDEASGTMKLIDSVLASVSGVTLAASKGDAIGKLVGMILGAGLGVFSALWLAKKLRAKKCLPPAVQ